jgi:prepilin-type N-terminal cleavage/methylation domain-containing protein
MKTRYTTNGIRGMTLIEVLVVITVLAIFFAMIDFGAPQNSKKKAQRINCVNNLKQIGLAFRIWEGDNGGKFPMEISATNTDAMKLIAGGRAYVLWQIMSNELSTPKILHCVADTEHNYGTNFTTDFSDANVSYFFGLDVTTNATQMLLAGDDNLAVNDVPARTGILTLWTNSPITWTAARHKYNGNIALTDGSVQQITSVGLQTALTSSITTNPPLVRLVIP